MHKSPKNVKKKESEQNYRRNQEIHHSEFNTTSTVTDK